jgi:hypothetical protein
MSFLFLHDASYGQWFSRCSPFLIVALFSGSTLADEPTTENRALAEVLFREAKTLSDKGQFEQACPKFQESHRLDPKPGTILNLAVCHEKQGKTASAWLDYIEAASFAGRAGQKDREAFAKDQAAKLEKLLPHLIVRVPATTPGIVVKLDSAALSEAAWGIAAPINPGNHFIEAMAPGYKGWSQTITIENASSNVDVTVPKLEQELNEKPKTDPSSGGTTVVVQEKPKQSDPPPPSPKPQFNKPLWIGIAAGGVGLAGMIIGPALGVHTFTLRDAGNVECGPEPENTFCTKKGIDLQSQAATSATVSTVGFVMGGLGLGAGAALILIGLRHAPSAPTRAWVLPHIDRTGVGVSAGYSF